MRVTRPPTDGEANRAVQRLVARALHIPTSALELVGGGRSRHKRFRVIGIGPEELQSRLQELAD